MNNKDLLQKIELLEERIRQLEARPAYVPVPVVMPQPCVPAPYYPRPWEGPWVYATYNGSGY